MFIEHNREILKKYMENIESNNLDDIKKHEKNQ